MVNRKYNRIFVLMTGKNAGQSLNGSCDMEVIDGRGRLYAYVGKLNKLTYTPRNLYLISVGLMGSVAISAGKLEPKGRNVSIEAEFDPDNMFGSGMHFEEVNAIAIWGENEGPRNAVLEGFVSKRLDWHTKLEIFSEAQAINNESRTVAVPPEAAVTEVKKAVSTMEKTEKLCRSVIDEPEPIAEYIEEIEEIKEQNEVIPMEVTPIEVTPIEVTPIEVTEEVKERVKEEVSEIAEKLTDNINEADKLKDIAAAEALAAVSPHDTFRAIAQKFRRELDMLDEMGIIDKRMFIDENEPDDKSDEVKESAVKADTVTKTEAVAETKTETKTEEKVEAEQSKNVNREMTLTDRLFEMNDKLVTDDGREWVKIDYREAYFIDDAIKDIRCRFVKNAARKGRHMIIGRDGRSLYIGVPGKDNERNYAELNGFYEFFTVKNLNCAGYWIKAI